VHLRSHRLYVTLRAGTTCRPLPESEPPDTLTRQNWANRCSFAEPLDMPASLDLFRDHGIIPDQVQPPAGPVRASLGTGTVIGQFIGTGVMLALGIGMAVVVSFAAPFPANVGVAILPLALFGGIVFFVTRKDYAWIELDGHTIRARHLYTRWTVERKIEDVQELLTMVFQVRNLTTVLTEKMVGRVRGIQIRFRDGKTPLYVSRADPKMTNAKELIEAIVYRLWESGPVDAEVIDFEGAPLIRRIYRA
jgi:hypothetical protein